MKLHTNGQIHTKNKRTYQNDRYYYMYLSSVSLNYQKMLQPMCVVWIKSQTICTSSKIGTKSKTWNWKITTQNWLDFLPTFPIFASTDSLAFYSDHTHRLKHFLIFEWSWWELQIIIMVILVSSLIFCMNLTVCVQFHRVLWNLTVFMRNNFNFFLVS